MLTPVHSRIAGLSSIAPKQHHRTGTNEVISSVAAQEEELFNRLKDRDTKRKAVTNAKRRLRKKTAVPPTTEQPQPANGGADTLMRRPAAAAELKPPEGSAGASAPMDEETRMRRPAAAPGRDALKKDDAINALRAQRPDGFDYIVVYKGHHKNKKSFQCGEGKKARKHASSTHGVTAGMVLSCFKVAYYEAGLKWDEHHPAGGAAVSG